MEGILVATDFSTRSDRAIRRASLLARRAGAVLTLAHVVDDDQPQRRVDAERGTAMALLNEYAASIRDIEGVTCNPRVVSGDASQAIVDTTVEVRAGLTVIGAHRRRLPRDIFLGTTAERTIRTSRVPVLMVRAVPAQEYRRILVGVDLSDNSAQALHVTERLRLGGGLETTVLHVFDAPGIALMMRPSVSKDDLTAYLAREGNAAKEQLDRFLADQRSAPTLRLVRPQKSSTAGVLLDTAGETSADLIIVGTHGRTGIAKLLLGSVAEEILRDSEIDVLTVPANR